MTALAGLVLDIALAVAVVGLAGLALFARDRVASVVFFLIFGLVLAIVWARLGAPDVALAEAAIGAGLTGALLIDAVRAPDIPVPGAQARRLDVATSLVAVALGIPFLAILVAAVADLGSTPGLGPAVREVLPETGVSHPVTAVLLNLRSYDTLLEVAVLLVAAVVAVALHPDDGLADVAVPPRAEPVVAGLVAIVTPMTVVLAGWLLVLGTSGPGGAFQAGAILAGALVLLRLTGRRTPAPGRRSLAILLVAGIAVFLAVAFGTAVAGAGLLVLDSAWATIAILTIETALTVSIAGALATLYVANQPGGPR